MEVTYEATETTTHKAMLPDGSFIRSDMENLWIRFAKDGRIKYASLRQLDFIEGEDLEWVEDEYKRVYEYTVDVS